MRTYMIVWHQDVIQDKMVTYLVYVDFNLWMTI
jgi:hypothetical protein